MIITVSLASHPRLSVTITIYSPAIKPEISSVSSPVDHVYSYGGTPPEILKSIEAEKSSSQYSSIDLIKNNSNWKPQTSIKLGLTKTIESFNK